MVIAETLAVKDMLPRRVDRIGFYARTISALVKSAVHQRSLSKVVSSVEDHTNLQNYVAEHGQPQTPAARQLMGEVLASLKKEKK